jgi:glucosamine 6-phosphate synthetase-like amidotransferase/phosphosugar isomerase protein
LALVDNDMPVVILAPQDDMLDKLKSNMEEVQARGGELFVFADEKVALLKRPPACGQYSKCKHMVSADCLQRTCTIAVISCCGTSWYRCRPTS